MFYRGSSEQIREKLKNLGYFKVREKLKITKDYSSHYSFPKFQPEEVPVVEAWLEEQDKLSDIELRKKELNLSKESNDIALASNKKANEAKDTSKYANKIAIVAVLFSLFALLISILKG